jgi:hypothetical protein
MTRDHSTSITMPPPGATLGSQHVQSPDEPGPGRAPAARPCVHPAATLPDAELRGLMGALVCELARNPDALREMALTVDAAVVANLLAETRAWEERQRHPSPAPPREEELAHQSRLLAADFLETHREELEAFRASRPPAELPTGSTSWLVLDAFGQVWGVGTTIEQAHRAAVERLLAPFASAEQAVALLEELEESDVPSVENLRYLRVSGAALKVEQLVGMVL